MLSRRTVVAFVVLVAAAFGPLSGCCKSKAKRGAGDVPIDPVATVPTASARPTSSVVKFNKVPLQVTIPAGWNEAQNTPQWLVYRPGEGGALVAMSGEKDCGLVEGRFAGALRELGLTNVAWNAPQHTSVNGLRTKIAEGTAYEQNQLSYVKYSLTYAAGSQGCLITLYNVWQRKAGNYRAVSDQIIMSVASKEVPNDAL